MNYHDQAPEKSCAENSPVATTQQQTLEFADGPQFKTRTYARRKLPAKSKWTVAPEAMGYLLTMRERERARQQQEARQ